MSKFIETLLTLRANSAYDVSTSTDASNLQINNTLRVQYTNIQTVNQHQHAALWLKDCTSTNTGTWFKLDVGTYDGSPTFRFNNTALLDANNAERELEYIFADRPFDLASITITGNIADNNLGYVNFTSNINGFPTGADGVGIRYNHSNSSLEFASNAGTWVSLTSILNFEYFRNLLDVDVVTNPITTGQYIKYTTVHGQLKYTGATLALSDDPTPSLGGNLIMNGRIIVNANGGTILAPADNSANSSATNYVTIKNSGADADPIITVEDSTTAANVSLVIKSKGAGSIDLVTPDNGDISIQSKSLSIHGYTRVSTYYTSTATATPPHGFYAGNNGWTMPISSDTVIFDFNESSVSGQYAVNVVAGDEGQILNVVFVSARANNDIVVRLEFGANKLGTGDGVANRIIFNNSGQSATLIYLNGGILDGGGIWQLRNTGAYVE